MNQRLRTVLNIALALIIIIGAVILLRQQLRWHVSEESQDKAAQIVQFTPPVEPFVPAAPSLDESDPIAEELAGLDINALRKINSEVVGWLYIPDTEIFYPLLQSKDNDYYLKHTWEKKWSASGSIFMDYRCAQTFDDFNTILYGHRMNNGAMFGPLHEYADLDFWQKYPYIYVADGICVRRYMIFAAWEPSITSVVYMVNPDTAEGRQKFVDQCVHSSLIDTEMVPKSEDKLLTLSTCTGNGHDTRWVVQGVLDKVYDISAADSH